MYACVCPTQTATSTATAAAAATVACLNQTVEFYNYALTASFVGFVVAECK